MEVSAVILHTDDEGVSRVIYAQRPGEFTTVVGERPFPVGSIVTITNAESGIAVTLNGVLMRLREVGET